MPPARPNLARLLLAGALPAAVLSWAVSSAPAQEVPAAPGAGTPRAEIASGVSELVRIVSDSGEQKGARDAAAARLVALCPDPGALAALDRLLRSDPADDATRAILLGAVAGAHRPADGLFPIVRDLAMERSSVREQAIAACAPFRTRASARVLVGLLNSELQRAAGDALVAMTGRDDLGADPAKWRAWLERVEALDDAGWNSELVAGLGGRTARALRANDTTQADLVSAYRRLHLATPTEERPALLAELLAHRQPVVRALGFDLALREISAGRDLGQPVVDAALALLKSPTAAARSQGAILLTRLAPESAPGAIKAALLAETDPSAADPLLRAAARWPDEELLPTILSWLQVDGTLSAACEASWAAEGRGLLAKDDDRGAVLASLRTRDPARLGPDGLRLLVTLGDEADLHAVAALLKDESTRRAAADALTLRREGVPVLLAALQFDGSLFEYACRAVALHDPSALNFRVLAQAKPADEGDRLPRLVDVAREMPTPELIAATDRLDAADPLCESLLVLLADPDRADGSIGDRAKGLVRLAEIRVDTGRAEAALAVLPAREGFDPADPIAKRISRVLVLASLQLGRVREAEAVDAPASVWIEGLERTTDAAVVAQVANHIDTAFGSNLTADERRRVAQVRARADASSKVTTPEDG